jgi:cation:H+ antiporter
MLVATLSVFGGLVLLAFGAEGLVRGAASGARRLGLSPLLIGLTVVAYGTSAPELVVSLHAAVGGNADVALGNVVGSNIANVGLILGLSALLCPIQVRAQILRIDLPIMIGISGLLLGLLWDGVVGRLNGVVLVAGALAYTVVCIWGARDEPRAAVEETFDAGVPSAGSVGRDLLYGAGGLALLVLGARLLVTGAVTIAETVGLSTTVIGLTVVAVGTSLPELATAVVAALRGQSDLVLGNVVGSNIFNVLGILGVTAVIQPVDGTGLAWWDGGVMLGFAVLTLPLFWTRYTFSRLEGGLLLAGYVAYVGVLIGTAV